MSIIYVLILMLCFFLVELNFKLIMCRCGRVSRGRSRTGQEGINVPAKRTTSSLSVCLFVGHSRAAVHGSGREGARSDARDEREEEIKRLRNALGSEKNRNKQLITVIERRVLDYQKSNR